MIKKFTKLELIKPPLASDTIIRLGHSEAYLERLSNMVPDSGIIQLDQDTFMSPGTLRSAKRSVGAIITAVDSILENTIRLTMIVFLKKMLKRKIIKL